MYIVGLYGKYKCAMNVTKIYIQKKTSNLSGAITLSYKHLESSHSEIY